MRDFSSITLGELFDEAAKKRADATFLIFEESEYSYHDAKRAVDALAKGLVASGFKRGDHLALWMSNSPLFIFVQQAAFKVGIVLVVLNTHSVSREILYMIKQSDCMGIIFENTVFKQDFLALLGAILSKSSRNYEISDLNEVFPKLKTIIGVGDNLPKGIISIEKLVELGRAVSNEELAAISSNVDCKDVALMLYTSGTTGIPKGVMLQHRSVALRSKVFADWFELTKDDVGFYGQPLYHIFGCVAAIEGTLVSGGSLCLQKRFNAIQGLKDIEKHRCSMLYCVPTVLEELLHHPDMESYNLSSMRVGIVSGAPAPASLVIEAKQRFVPRLASGYGCTECCAMVSTTELDDSPQIVSTRVGKPNPHCEIKIFGADKSLALPQGVDGEIGVKSDFNMVAYYKMDEETKATIDERGFLHTGDIGHFDENGYLVLTGRKKDMIIIGGVNVYPTEIEEALIDFLGIAGIQVVGAPDDRLGEVPYAYIVLEEGCEGIDLEELCAFGRKNLSNFKIPKYVYFLDEFPITGTGKPKKKELREMAKDTLPNSERLY